MASVRLSNDLRHTIGRNAMQAFDVSTPEPQWKTNDVEFIIDQIINCEAQKTLAQIANQYTTIPTYRPTWTYNRTDRSAFGFHTPVKQKVTDVELVFEGNNDQKNNRERIKFPRSVELYAADDAPSVPIATFSDIDARNKIRTMVNDFRTRYEEYRQKRHDYDNTISRLLAQCTTLKQFLTAWPAGESFVPQDKISELHTKVTRIQKARAIKEKVEFDDSSVNQVVLTSKLMGS